MLTLSLKCTQVLHTFTQLFKKIIIYYFVIIDNNSKTLIEQECFGSFLETKGCNLINLEQGSKLNIFLRKQVQDCVYRWCSQERGKSGILSHEIQIGKYAIQFSSSASTSIHLKIGHVEMLIFSKYMRFQSHPLKRAWSFTQAQNLHQDNKDTPLSKGLFINKSCASIVNYTR